MCKFIKSALKLNRTCRFYKSNCSDPISLEMVLQSEFIHDQVMTLWMKKIISESEGFKRLSASRALLIKVCEQEFKKKLKFNSNLI